MSTVSTITALPVVDLRDHPGDLRKTLRTVAHEVGSFYLTGLPSMFRPSKVGSAKIRRYE